jgi:hypothetical protein
MYWPVLPRLGFVLPRLGFVLRKYEPVLPRLGFVLLKYEPVLTRLGFVLPKYKPVLLRLGFVLLKYELVLPRLGFVLRKYELVLLRLGFVLPKYKLVLLRLGFVLRKYEPVLLRLGFVLRKYEPVLLRVGFVLLKYGLVLLRLGFVLLRPTPSSCRICNSAAESISICNAEKTADIFSISGMTKLRITNAYIHDCRIANSAGRRSKFPPPARRRLQPASYIKAKLQLCTGFQSRKAVSICKEHQVTVLIFSGRDFSLGVTERAKQELCFYIRRRLEPTPSGGPYF